MARNLEQDGELLDAVNNYDKIVTDLGNHFTLDSISTRSRQLKQTREYKKALKERDHIAIQEKAWSDKLIGRIRQEINREDLPADFKWWQKELNRLNKNYAENERKIYKEMGKRLQYMIFAVSIESLQASVAGRNEKEVDYYASLMTANWPENPYVSFRIASGYASLDRKDKALVYLKNAIDKGWKNKQWILNNTAFQTLKGNGEFELLLKRL